MKAQIECSFACSFLRKSPFRDSVILWNVTQVTVVSVCFLLAPNNFWILWQITSSSKQWRSEQSFYALWLSESPCKGILTNDLWWEATTRACTLQKTGEAMPKHASGDIQARREPWLGIHGQPWGYIQQDTWRDSRGCRFARTPPFLQVTVLQNFRMGPNHSSPLRATTNNSIPSLHVSIPSFSRQQSLTPSRPERLTRKHVYIHQHLFLCPCPCLHLACLHFFLLNFNTFC